MRSVRAWFHAGREHYQQRGKPRGNATCGAPDEDHGTGGRGLVASRLLYQRAEKCRGSDLELAIIEKDDARAVAFPCRRVVGGWEPQTIFDAAPGSATATRVRTPGIAGE